MKKTLTSLLSSVLISTICSNTISCANNNFTKKLWVVVPGYIHDKTYHETTYKGANIFAHKKYGANKKASYYEVQTYNNNNFIQAYKTLRYYNAEYAVLTDFTQAPYLKYTSKYVKKIVFIGGAVNKEETGNSKMIGVTFKNEVAGFYAGILDAGYLSTLPADKRITSTFGGVDIALAVDNYMAGYLFAHAYWNYLINQKLDLTQLNSIVHYYDKTKNPEYVKLTKYQGSIETNGVMKLDDTINNYFTNSFLISKARPLVNALINNNAITIFPVAGIQIADVIDAFKNLRNTNYYKTIGVDTDQSKIYGNKFILTSAIDKLDVATNDCLNELNNLKYGQHKNVASDLDKHQWCGVANIPQNITDVLHNNKKLFYIFNTIKRFTTYYNDKIKGNNTWKDVAKLMNNMNYKEIIEGK